jgi:alcohol dehydrogenase class IV
MIFRYLFPRINLIFGEGALESLGKETQKLGKSVLLVTGRKSMQKLGFLGKARKYLEQEGLKVFHYGEVEPNPTVDIVDEGAELALQRHCEVIVGMGGGSAMDSAKAIAVVAGHSKSSPSSIWDFSVTQDEPLSITEATLPVVAVATTSGTGSHVTRYAVISNPGTREKPGFGSEYMYPRASIVDLNIAKNMSPELTARTGFDTLAHVLEAFVSRKGNPIVDSYCLKAIELVSGYLSVAYHEGDNMEARFNMALADTYAGLAIAAASAALPHAMAHPISGHYPNVDHGVALAAISCNVMEFNVDNGDKKTVHKYCQIANTMGKSIRGCSKEKAKKSIQAVRELLEKVGLRANLSQLGIDQNKISNMAKDAFRTMRRGVENNPVPVTEEEVKQIYRRSF